MFLPTLHTGTMASLNSLQLDEVLAELRGQGLHVTVHNASNEVWYVKESGSYEGYTVTEAELFLLRNEQQLNIRGIQSLG
jgi:hypothetical protein